MGENKENIFIIGSPDIDIMFSNSLPPLEEALSHYQIPFQKYAIVMFHPVTTEVNQMSIASETLVDVLINSQQNYIVIYPNNDNGSNKILQAYDKLKNNENFRIFPSLRFEYFLVLLKHSSFIIGNSSAGIREAPYYGIPSINMGSRQNNRSTNQQIIHTDYSKISIFNAIQKAIKIQKYSPEKHFGTGSSDQKFLKILHDPKFWKISRQKSFFDFTSLTT